MVLPAIGVLVVIGAALWLLPRTGLNPFSNENKAEEKNRERAERERRDAKGAIGNTVDFFFGTGSYSAAFNTRTKGNTSKPAAPTRSTAPGPRHTKGRGRIA